ncbi:hypothetical protein O1D97_17465 [Marinomonas sp. 15G1-11]|uniref:Uncharacterized protein n=1 Tax=Marinomonas phaeophyticola TaxID=3004091 RepID=A0ABT4JYP6_9GAMM|nr:hypothetical protein [Marinomonas sp. 15G1-11]MCZ2723346.1 hypothetical protein [Marinomonas sp. 15G1-11]
MKTEKSLTELLKNVDTSYMSEFEKIELIARAERAEAISNGIFHVARSIKQFAINTKNALTHVSVKGQQA